MKAILIDRKEFTKTIEIKELRERILWAVFQPIVSNDYDLKPTEPLEFIYGGKNGKGIPLYYEV